MLEHLGLYAQQGREPGASPIANAGRDHRVEHLSPVAQIILCEPAREPDHPRSQQARRVDDRRNLLELSRADGPIAHVDAPADHLAWAVSEGDLDAAADLDLAPQAFAHEVIEFLAGSGGKDNGRHELLVLVVLVPGSVVVAKAKLLLCHAFGVYWRTVSKPNGRVFEILLIKFGKFVQIGAS